MVSILFFPLVIFQMSRGMDGTPPVIGVRMYYSRLFVIPSFTQYFDGIMHENLISYTN